MAKINFPYNLQNGKKSDADHVMANFNVLKDRLNSGLQADNLEEDSVTDDIIGNRTVSQDIADTSANTGKLTQLLSWIVKEIKAIKGTDDWKESASSLAQKVDKEAGKQLSTEDFTTEEKTKLAGLSNYEHPATHPATMITEDSTHRFATDNEKVAWNGAVSDSHVHSNKTVLDKFTEVDGELRYNTEPIYEHPATHSADIIVDGTTNKVFTAVEKTKLASLSNYEHPATHPATMITEDSTHRFVTDAEKDAWHGAASDSHVHSNKTVLDKFTEVDGELRYNTEPIYEHPATHSADIIVDGTTNKVFTAVEKTKLASLSNYEHPATHSADIIVDGTTNKVFTAVEKTKLAGLSNYEHPATHSADIIVDGTTNKVFTAVEKTKLAGLSNYEHPATHPATMIIEDSTHRFMTDEERDKLSGLFNYEHPATHSADIIVDGTTNKVFTAVEKTKLAGLSNYEHPATHPATMITEDSTHRFVTDSEKSSWDSAAASSHSHTNSAVLAKFSEEDGTLCYDGEAIGGGGETPANLTDTTLTLGGRFKIYYNSTTDSLDFEVLGV